MVLIKLKILVKIPKVIFVPWWRDSKVYTKQHLVKNNKYILKKKSNEEDLL